MEPQKEILFISFRFPPQNPGGVIRGIKFIKYLARFGWKVHVFVPQGSTQAGHEKDLNHPNIHIQEVACRKPFETVYSFLRKTRDIFCLKRTLKTESFSAERKSSLVHTPSFLTRILWLLRFPDEAIFWRRELLRSSKDFFQKHPSCNLVFCHGPPFSPFLFVNKLKKYGKKIVLDFRDTWSDDPDYVYPFLFLKKIIFNLEKKVLSEADAVITVTDTLRKNFISKEPSVSNKIYTITNGYDLEDFLNFPSNVHPNHFRILHAGNLFLRDTTLLLAGLQRFIKMNPKDSKQIDCHFWGSPDPVTEQAIRDLELEPYCKQMGVVPHAQMIEEYKSAALFLMILQEGPVYDAAIPGKIFEYAATQRPVLAFGPKGEAQQMIEKNNWGTFLVGKVSVEQVAQTIQEYYLLWKNKKLIPFNHGETLQPYSRETLTRQLENILSR